MANTFSLKVIACDRIFFDGRCTQVVLPSAWDALPQ